MYLGRLYHRRFQFQKAIECKRKALALTPEDPEIHYSLGCSYGACGETPQAIECFLEALKINPNYAEACEALADQYFIIGRDGKAEEFVSKANTIRSAIQ